MNLLGWMFFRNAPVLQQPYGANWQYGMDISSSVFYSDPVTLVALLLKPFKSLLPARFQYFGIWILICYLLQSLFAWKLLDRLTDRVWHKFFATLFFVLAPPFVWRLQFHFQLGSHWLLLDLEGAYRSEKFVSASVRVRLSSDFVRVFILAKSRKQIQEDLVCSSWEHAREHVGHLRSSLLFRRRPSYPDQYWSFYARR